MLSTSIHVLLYVGRKVIKKEQEVNKALVFGLIMLFVFGLDIVGVYILKKQINKKEIIIECK